MKQNNFVDSYNMQWTLRKDDGEYIYESYYNISLSDFEIIYGNNIHPIIVIEMRLSNGSVSDNDNHNK